ncbi:hypothetical protein IMG5_187390 [Ichthyophthirius multifiliis]|uniref:Uncharacterized protein n=1 Tax=Ichthyophthirius multifiliis TaxID=5932 RepID=G0R3S8_ICHMU|nr:hypothetical protein IMG5_187390 [Ichthyophthirius multifiliis]EGR27895.1 hypothetical protein IMG5_187390 [Ichthyophthirius multifiliis]|eukprot:XP_004027240.1 hypothetical protein IMG5_187390 [Ichthyophthirius multifiliis]
MKKDLFNLHNITNQSIIHKWNNFYFTYKLIQKDSRDKYLDFECEKFIPNYFLDVQKIYKSY